MNTRNVQKPQSLRHLFKENISLGNTCVAYRLPQEKEIHFCAGKLQLLQNEILPDATFLIAPFRNENAIYALCGKCFNVSENSISKEEHIEIAATALHLPESISKKHFTGIAQNAVEEIDARKLEKVVLSRPYKMPLPENFSALSFFQKLSEKYPDAFVYLLMSEELGNWIAATPELLLQTDDEELETVALAGTQHISMAGKMLQAEEIFSAKEIHEQAIVTEYIKQVLTPFANEINTTVPQLKKAGNLYHLQSRLSAKMKEKNPLPLLRKLHPTPAVCGIPLQKAKDFIAENEKYNRSLYSGFLGPVKGNNVQVFVNLRAMQFTQKEAVFYVGAGIVAGSNPEKEWQETADKMRTLLDVLEN